MMVTTVDGWVEIHDQAANAYMVDHQPSENCNVSLALLPLLPRYNAGHLSNHRLIHTRIMLTSIAERTIALLRQDLRARWL